MPYAFNCGSVQPMCCGMWRCSGLVLGIIGMSASSTRSLGFKIRVYNYDAHEVVLDFVDVTIPYSVTYLLEYIPMDALSDSDEEETETL
ncbi:hypothetical protein Tco_1546715 [Tanacetum coccineum]